MRVLFVSGVATGGSARSTRELAAALASRGHVVGALFGTTDRPRARHVHRRAVNLSVKIERSSWAAPLQAPVSWASGLVGRRPRQAGDPSRADGVETWETIVPENAFPVVARAFGPEVVVVSSIDRMSWRRIRPLLARTSTPAVLYVREQNAFGHLTISRVLPDLLVTNSDAHTSHARSLGFDAVTVPSLVTFDGRIVESTREHVLYVNPTPLYDLEVALALAHDRPDVRFRFAESTPIEPAEWESLAARVASAPNVELTHFVADPRALYGNARVLLAPYRTNGRPRVVLEAQANGIPVLGSDLPTIREAVGPGGRVVDPDAPRAEWAAALSELIDSPVRYDRYVEAARAHAGRPEVDPAAIVETFERELGALVACRA
jgi:glycosyltransferase involved in cell wall biosynthesis